MKPLVYRINGTHFQLFQENSKGAGGAFHFQDLLAGHCYLSHINLALAVCQALSEGFPTTTHLILTTALCGARLLMPFYGGGKGRSEVK